MLCRIIILGLYLQNIFFILLSLSIFFFYILDQNVKFHHAGWDAYYTGYCFIQMSKIIKESSCMKA